MPLGSGGRLSRVQSDICMDFFGVFDGQAHVCAGAVQRAERRESFTARRYLTLVNSLVMPTQCPTTARDAEPKTLNSWPITRL